MDDERRTGVHDLVEEEHFRFMKQAKWSFKGVANKRKRRRWWVYGRNCNDKGSRACRYNEEHWSSATYTAILCRLPMCKDSPSFHRRSPEARIWLHPLLLVLGEAARIKANTETDEEQEQEEDKDLYCECCGTCEFWSMSSSAGLVSGRNRNAKRVRTHFTIFFSFVLWRNRSAAHEILIRFRQGSERTTVLTLHLQVQTKSVPWVHRLWNLFLNKVERETFAYYSHLIVERTEGTTISGIEQHAPEQRTSYIVGSKTKKMYCYIYSAIPILFATEKRWKKKTHTRHLVHWPLQEGKLHGGRLLPSLRLHNSIARHTQEASEEEPALVFWALKKPLPTIISTPARAKCQLRLQKSKNLKMAGQPCVPKASTITPLL